MRKAPSTVLCRRCLPVASAANLAAASAASNDCCHSERAVARVGEESPADGAGLDLRQGIPRPPAAPPSRNDKRGHSLLIGMPAVPLAQDDTNA